MLKSQFLRFLLILVVGARLLSCTNPSSRVDHSDRKEGIAGRFVNYTFLDHIQDSIAGHVPVNFYQMNFVSADSVDAYHNSWEEPLRLSYKKEENNYRLVVGKSDRSRDLFFTLNKDGSFTLMDSIGKAHINFLFRRIDDAKLSLDQLINEQMVAGTYTLYQDGKPTKQKVVFTPNGRVSGLKNYGPYYSICYSGDCVDVTVPASNTIGFYKSDGGYAPEAQKMCAFRIDKRNKLLKIYKVGESPKDMKGEVPTQELLFDLRQ